MYTNQTSERQPLPRLNVALVVADAESIDPQLCTRLLAHALRSSASSAQRPRSLSTVSASEYVTTLLAARAVHDGAALPAPAANGDEPSTSKAVPTNDTPGEPELSTAEDAQRKASATNRGASPSSLSARATGLGARPTVLEDKVDSEGERRRAYLARHWPLSEFVESAEGAPVVFVHALAGEDSLIAEASDNTNNIGTTAAPEELHTAHRGRKAHALLMAAITAAYASRTTSVSRPPAELMVVWAVRHPLLLSALATTGTCATQAAALIPRAVFYLQPGDADDATLGGTDASSSLKRGAPAVKSAAGGRSGSANSKKAAAPTSRPTARRTSAGAKGKTATGHATAGPNSSQGAAEAFDFFFDSHTQRYDAAAVARYLYDESPNFATFVARQCRFQDQLRRLQSLQLMAATSAFATRRPTVKASSTPSPAASAFGPAGIVDSTAPPLDQSAVLGVSGDTLGEPFLGTLFADDSDRLCADFETLQQLLASRTGAGNSSATTGTTTPLSSSALTLLEDCLLAQRISVPSVVALAAWQWSHREELSGKRGQFNDAVAASTSGVARKKASTSASAASTMMPSTITAATTAASMFPATSVYGSLRGEGDTQDVLLPVWVVTTVPVGVNLSTAAECEGAAEGVGTSALAAALPQAVRRVETVMSPVLGVIHQYDQWSRHRPVYPLVTDVLGAVPPVCGGSTGPTGVTANDTNASSRGGEHEADASPLLQWRADAGFGDTHLSNTLGGLSVSEAERVFVLGATGTGLLAEMAPETEGALTVAATAASEHYDTADPVSTRSAMTGIGSACSHASTLATDPSRFARYQEQKRRAGTFTPLTAAMALIAQTLTTLERKAPLHLVKLVERGAAPPALLFATTRENRDGLRNRDEDGVDTTQLCSDARSAGVRVVDGESAAHFASSLYHRGNTHVTTRRAVGGFFRPYTHSLLGRQGDNAGTTSVLPDGPAVRRGQAPNAALHGLLSAYTKQQNHPVTRSGSQVSPDSRPSTTGKKSARSSSPAGRSGSRSGGGSIRAGAGGQVAGVATLPPHIREALMKEEAAARAERTTAESAFVVPNDHSTEQFFPPPYPEEVQWLVEQYVKRGLGYFAMAPGGGDTVAAPAGSAQVGGSGPGSMIGDHHQGHTTLNHNASFALAVRRMRELDDLPIRIETAELASAFLSTHVLDANTVLNTTAPTAATKGSGETDSRISNGAGRGSVIGTLPRLTPLSGAAGGASPSPPPVPLTPFALVKRCALPLSTFEVQLQRSVERSLTSRERQHALQRVLLVELARSAGFLSYTALEEVATHTGSLGAIEEVVSMDVVHREILRLTLRFGDHLTSVYEFKDNPPMPAGHPSTAATASNVLLDASTDGVPYATSAATAPAVRTSAASHNAENVYPPRRAERMWVAGLYIPPLRRRRMVFVHPYLGRLGPTQLVAVRAALAAMNTSNRISSAGDCSGDIASKSAVTGHTKSAGDCATTAHSRLATSLYAQLLQQHLDKRSFFIAEGASKRGPPHSTYEHALQVPPLRVAAEGHEVIYPYCDALIEVTTTSLVRRCSYVKEREITASLEYAVAPPPVSHGTASRALTDAQPPSPESHAYLSVRFDDGLILTCTPQAVRRAAAATAAVETAGFPASGAPRRPRSRTENDLNATRLQTRRTSFIDSVPPTSAAASGPIASDGRRPPRGVGGAAASGAKDPSKSKHLVKGTRSTSTAPNGGSGGSVGGDACSEASGARAALARALTATFASVAPISASGNVRLWHARRSNTSAEATEPSEASTAMSPPAARAGASAECRGSLTGSRQQRSGKEAVDTAAAMDMTITTNNFVLRCHPTTNTLTLHYFGDERRPGNVVGNGGTTSWDSVAAVHEYRGADSPVVSTLEREVTRSVDANTGVVTRVFESGVSQLLFPDGALSTRYPVDAVALTDDGARKGPVQWGSLTSDTSAHSGSITTNAMSTPAAAAGHSCILELITSASGVRYVRRVTRARGTRGSHTDVGGDKRGGGTASCVAHRSVRLRQPPDEAVREVASYDAVHHCHMLSRSDGVCTTYYYRRPGAEAGGREDARAQASPGDSISATARLAVHTPSSTRKFASSGPADRSSDFDVVARVTLHADGTAITTFAAAGAPSQSFFVSPALAPLLEDVATVEAACHGGQDAAVSVRWALESARMPRVFLLPPPSPNPTTTSGVCNGLEGSVISPFAAPAGRSAQAAAATSLARHDAKAGFYVMLGDGTTLRRNVQIRAVGAVACPFLETVLTRPSATAVRLVHDSAVAIIEPADAMESNQLNPVALAVGECLPMFDLALGGVRLVDRRSHVTEVRGLFSPLDVQLTFAPYSWQQLLRQLVHPTYSPHRLPKQKMAALEALQAEEAAAEQREAEAGKWPSMQRRLRTLAEAFIVDNKLLHPDVLHNLQRARFVTPNTAATSADGSASSEPAQPVPIKADNHLIGISPLFFARLAGGECVQYLGASNLQDILRQTDVEAGAPMFLSRGSASGEPGVQQLTLFRVCVESDTNDPVGGASSLVATSAYCGGPSVASPNAALSAAGARRGQSTRAGAVKATSAYAQSSIVSAFMERQQRLTALFSGTTPASNYLHSSARGSTGYFLDNVVSHPLTVLRGSSRWLPPALQPPRRFLRRLPNQPRAPTAQKGGAVSRADTRGHRLIQIEEDSKLAEDLRTGNTSSFELVRVFLEYEQLTLPAQNVVLQSEVQRCSTLQEIGRYHAAMTKGLAEVIPEKLDEQRRLQEIYYAARRAKKEQDAQQAAPRVDS